MIYFDTDVLVNFFVEQDEAKHLHPIAIEAVKQATDKGSRLSLAQSRIDFRYFATCYPDNAL